MQGTTGLSSASSALTHLGQALERQQIFLHYLKKNPHHKKIQQTIDVFPANQVKTPSRKSIQWLQFFGLGL